MSIHPRSLVLAFAGMLAVALSLGGVVSRARADEPVPSDPHAPWIVSGRLDSLSAGGAPGPARQIVVGLPQARVTADGELVVEPKLDVYQGSAWVGGASLLRPAAWTSPPPTPSAPRPGMVSYVDPPEGLPLPQWPGSGAPLATPGPEVVESGEPLAPIFEDVLEPVEMPMRRPWWGLNRALPCTEGGLGRERLAFAPFQIDVAQPFSNFRIRGATFFNQQFPDRAEFFWGKTQSGRGPKLAEKSVDYTQLRFLSEMGGKLFSLGTELPFSWVDPEVNKNHTGLGDLNLTTKTVMVNGDQWQITQIFRTYFNTGSASMGNGVGRIQLEPGFLLRYKWNDITYFHGEIKYWIPLGGDPTFSGQVLDYGFGVSHLLWESDRIAVIPTFEVVGYSILNGQMTTPSGAAVPADGSHIFNFLPGVRIAKDGGSDLGLFELGISGGWAVSNDHLYDAVLRVDVRWSY